MHALKAAAGGSNASRVALFDLDGTLSRENASLHFMRWLSRNDTEFFQKPLARKVLGSLPIDLESGAPPQMRQAWAHMWAIGLKGKSRPALEGHARTFFEAERDRIMYPSSYGLVSLFREHGFFTVLASSGAHEVGTLVAESLGIDRSYSTRIGHLEDRYTGRIETSYHRSHGKADILRRLDAELGVDFDRSFAISDSKFDIDLMAMVGHGVALNPTLPLRMAAGGKGWHVVHHWDAVPRLLDVLRTDEFDGTVGTRT